MQFAAGWYPVVLTSDLAQDPLPVSALGAELVLWRSSRTEVAAFIDRCPHRSVRLSGGQVTDGHLICPFHALAFSSDGACRFVPELGKAAPDLSASTVRVLEQDGLIWVHYPLDHKTVQDPPQLGCDGMHLAIATTETKAHITRLIENQIDYAHLPYIHRKTIGRRAPKNPEFSFRAHDKGVSGRFGGEASEQGYEYMIPSTFRIRITDKIAGLALFCPIDETATRVFLVSAQRVVRLPILRQLISRVMLAFNRRIYREDQAVVEGHPAGSSLESGKTERLLPSDRVIASFRRQWQERCSPEHLDQDVKAKIAGTGVYQA